MISCLAPRRIAFYSIFLLLMAILASGCQQQAKGEQAQANITAIANSTKSLGTVEVRQYQGKDLSSVNDFVENSIHGPQYIDITKYHLEISGLVKNPKNYTYDEVLNRQKYSKVVTLNCVEGWSVTVLWQGVLLSDLIDEAGAAPDANTVIFYSYDGYSTSLPLGYVKNRQILLAYAMNNVTMPPERGYPFMVVAEDKWGYKWAKWVTRIEVTSNSSYKGYWETFGYSQNGSLNAPMFDR
ncbi:Sulfoxide reductase catalytic subunit YedY [Candidatus Gugararchaeum adminiculabundum]|nr:Sulfoxide reductase catalytic subunit YedY [Candidatus Gugararchaeum adminiculabundum]